MAIEIIKYAYDDTGANSENLAQNEEHIIRPTDLFILPRGGCYYRASLRVTDLKTGLPLKEGFDYKVGNMYQEATLDVGQSIWGTIFFERELDTTIGVTVQYIGGKYSIDTVGISDLLNQIAENGDKILWDDIIKPDEGVLPAKHTHATSTDLLGTQEVVAALSAIADAIRDGRQSASSTSTNVDAQYIENRLDVNVIQHVSGKLTLKESHFNGSNLIIVGASGDSVIEIPAGLNVSKSVDLYIHGNCAIRTASSSTVVLSGEWINGKLDCNKGRVYKITPVDSITYMIS